MNSVVYSYKTRTFKLKPSMLLLHSFLSSNEYRFSFINFNGFFEKYHVGVRIGDILGETCKNSEMYFHFGFYGSDDIKDFYFDMMDNHVYKDEMKELRRIIRKKVREFRFNELHKMIQLGEI